MTQGNLGTRDYASPMLTRIGTIPAPLCAELLERLTSGAGESDHSARDPGAAAALAAN